MKGSVRKKPPILISVILLLAVAVGFFLPVSQQILTGLLIKGLLFIGIALFVYFFGISPATALWPSQSDDDELAFDVLGQSSEEEHDDTSWDGFSSAFKQFVVAFLHVIRNAIVADCAGFYLQKGTRGIEFQAGNSESGNDTNRSFVMENDLTSLVVRNREAIIEGNLPIGTTLSGIPGSDIRSFLGVPVKRQDKVIGVLALGSEATDGFGEEDQDFLDRCGGLISHVMTICHRGLQSETDQVVAQIHLELARVIQKVEDEESAILCFVQYIRRLFLFDRLTLCFRQNEQGVIGHVYGQVDNFDRGHCFPLEEGLNGWVIRRKIPLVIADIEQGEYIRPRYCRNEDGRHGLHAYLGIPLGRGEQAWGCLSIESRDSDQYSERSREVLESLAVHFESALDRIRMTQRLKDISWDDRAQDTM